MPIRKRPMKAAKTNPLVTAYINAAPEPARSRLRALRKLVREEAPEAVEKISYGLATWHQRQNLIHFGAFTHHVGVYPGAAAMVAFAAQLTAYKTSKGAIQLPHDQPIPVDLVRRIVRWRVAQVSALPVRRKSGASTRRSSGSGR